MDIKRFFSIIGITLLFSLGILSFAAAQEEAINLPAPISYVDQEGRLYLLNPDGTTQVLYEGEEIVDYAWWNDGMHLLMILRHESDVFAANYSLEDGTFSEILIEDFEWSDLKHLDIGTITQDDQKAAIAYNHCLGILHFEDPQIEDLICSEPVEDEDGNPEASGITYLDPAFSFADDEILVSGASDDGVQIMLFPLVGEVNEPETLGCCYYPQMTSDGLSIYAYANYVLAPDYFEEEGIEQQGIIHGSFIDSIAQELYLTPTLHAFQIHATTNTILVESINESDGFSEVAIIDFTSGAISNLAAGTQPKWRPDSEGTIPDDLVQITPTVETPEPIVISAEVDSLLKEHEDYVEELSSVTYESAGDEYSTTFRFLNPEFHLPFRQSVAASELDDEEMTEALLRLTLQDQLNKVILNDYSQINSYAVEVELTVAQLLNALETVNEGLYGENSRLSGTSDDMISAFSGRWSSSISNLELRFALQHGLLSVLELNNETEIRSTLAKSNYAALLEIMESGYLASYDRILNEEPGHVFSGSLEEMYSLYTQSQILVSETITKSESGGIGSLNLAKIKEMTVLLENLDLEDKTNAFSELAPVLVELRLVLNAMSNENIQGESLDCLSVLAENASEYLFAPDNVETPTCSGSAETENWVDETSWNLLRPWWKGKIENYILVLNATSKELGQVNSPIRMALLEQNIQFSGFSGSGLNQEAVADPLEDLDKSQAELDTATHMAFLLLTPPDGYLPSEETSYLLERIFLHNHLVLEYNLGVQAAIASPETTEKAVQTQIKEITSAIEANLLEISDTLNHTSFSNDMPLTGPQIFEFTEDISGTTTFSVPIHIIVRNIGSAPIHEGTLRVYAGESLLEQRNFDQVLYGQEIDVHFTLALPAPEHDHLIIYFGDENRYDLVQMPVDIRAPVLDEQWTGVLNSVCPGGFLALGGIFALSLVGLLIISILSFVSGRAGARPASPEE